MTERASMVVHMGRWADILFFMGMIWVLFGLSVTPSHKFYDRIVILTIYVPAFFFIVTSAIKLSGQVRNHLSLLLFFCLLLWAGTCSSLSGIPGSLGAIKHLLFILLFVVGGMLWGQRHPQSLLLTLSLSALLLSIGAFAALYVQFWLGYIQPDPDGIYRLRGLGIASNQNIGAALMGFAIILLVTSYRFYTRMISALWLLAVIILLTFVVVTWSRGGLFALALTIILMPVWDRRPSIRKIALLVCVASVTFIISALPYLLVRGMSGRQEILLKALELAAAHPLFGLGPGSSYELHIQGVGVFGHSHNLFIHIAISTGLPGLLLFLVLWVTVLWRGWQAKNKMIGRILLGTWVFSSIALQFDGYQIWDKPNPIWALIWLPVMLSLVSGTKEYAALGKNRADRKCHVMIVSRSIGGFGGMERVIREVLLELSQQSGIGNVCLRIFGHTGDRTWLEGLNYQIVEHRQGAVWRFLQLLRTIDKERPDVVISVAEKYLSDLRLARGLLAASFILFYWPHSRLKHMHGDGESVRPQTIRRLRQADHFLAIAEGIKDELLSMGIDPSRIDVIGNPVIERVRVISGSAQRNHFIFIGRLYSGHKRLKDLIDAVAGIKEPFSLHLIGDGEDREAIRNYIDTLGLNGKVTLSNGWIRDPWATVTCADTLILSSVYEGFPMVVAEALSYGIPCISSDCGSRDLIRDGINGYLYPVGDINRLREAIGRIMGGALQASPEEIKASISRYYGRNYYPRLAAILRKACVQASCD